MGIKIYINNTKSLLTTMIGRKLLMAEINKSAYLKAYCERVDSNLRLKALRELANWFEYNQSQMADDGFGTFYLTTGWTSSYPETTGYIVPSLLKFAKYDQKSAFETIAKKALNWLLTIQKPTGGWQGGYVHQNRPEIVFNTGQILRGLMAGYHHFNEQKYLDAAVKACRWLVSIQAENGSFDQHVYLNRARVYDSYVVAPMLEVYSAYADESFKTCAIKNIDWILREKQHGNGWFEDCDNTVKRNAKPILHTISYTIDGILDCAIFLKNDKYLQAAKKPTDVLLDQFLKSGKLNGRFDKNWKGSESLITTGCAQISIIWEKLFKATQEEKYKTGFEKMNRLLVAIHQRNVFEIKDSKGAIFGSFPFWGRYESFGCPNWASKYLMDALLGEFEMNEE